jgi:two-component system response regulator YesN
MHKVIIVDDEQDIREGIKDLVDWKAQQCEVVQVFKNGEQVVNYLTEHEVDIIVSDIKMPIMDGIMLAKHVHENYAQIQVIILTAFSEFKYAQKAIQYQVSDFIVKNNFLIELPQSIKKVVKKLKAQQYHYEGLEPGMLVNIHAKYRICAVEIKEGYKHNISDKIADLERILKVSVREEGILLLSNDEASFYIILDYEDYAGFSDAILKKKLEKFIVLSKQFVQLDLRLGISEVLKENESMSKGKKQAIEALGQVLSDDHKISFYTSSTLKIKAEDDWDIDIYMRSLLTDLKDKNKESLQIRQLEFSQYLNNDSRLIEQYKSDTHAITSYLLRKIKNLNDETEEKEVLFDKNSIFDIIYLSKTKASLNEVLQQVCASIKSFWEEDNTYKNVLIQKVDEIIKNNYQTKLSLKEISRMLFVNGSYLSRIYKKETSQTITEAINTYRIRCAKELLRQKKYKIYEIGSMVGIEDSAYFTHIFFRYEGETPSEYKNRNEE